MEKTCKTCMYCRRLKHNFEVGKGYEHSVCCTYLHDTDRGFIMQVSENGLACEVYKENEV